MEILVCACTHKWLSCSLSPPLRQPGDEARATVARTGFKLLDHQLDKLEPLFVAPPTVIYMQADPCA